MPLHTGYPIRIASPLDTFDGSVRGVGSDTQILARLLNRLVVGAVDDRLRTSRKRTQAASRLEYIGVSGVVFGLGIAFRHEIPLPMGRCSASLALEVLNQGATEIDVQELAAIADGQYRLFFSKSMLEDGVVGFFPSRVSRRGQSPVHRAVPQRLNISRAAGEHESIQRRNQARLPEEFCLGAQLFNALMAL